MKSHLDLVTCRIVIDDILHILWVSKKDARMHGRTKVYCIDWRVEEEHKLDNQR